MSECHVLLQFGANPFNMRLKDLDGRLACTVVGVGHDPNAIVRLTREAPWAQQHPTIMGPDNSFFYLGPESRPGYIIYGNGRTNIPMTCCIRKKKEGSTSRYFTTLSGKEYKWRKSPTRMECIDARHSTIAIWELSHPDDDHSATLTIKANGMHIVTEILTTLTLNLMAQDLGWMES
ncbi:hypothetical protein AMATHDRAFT_81533 [Amanita thiersii Skay4041]|uniref:DUF6593 domain-containing protein n=1 Tax=Amanita thiersii Skay4041 TaxID=703135 RepID=A0A2A9ND97_9AGAR|nr:hypothetical protein AMATHDRAFT_81533 [Amanita thiersii Skay4041]